MLQLDESIKRATCSYMQAPYEKYKNNDILTLLKIFSLFFIYKCIPNKCTGVLLVIEQIMNFQLASA